MERKIKNGLNEDLGGYVFYVTPDGKRGLVATTQDQSAASTWYDAQNIISDPANHNAPGKNFTDWRMPTKYELDLMCKAQNKIFLFAQQYYWCSTAVDEQHGYCLKFSSSEQSYASNSASCCVRAVRSFDISVGDITNLGNLTETDVTETDKAVAQPDPASQGVTIEVEGKKYLIKTLTGTLNEHFAKISANPWWKFDHRYALVFARALGDKLGCPNWQGTPQNRRNHHPPYFVYFGGPYNIAEQRRVQFLFEPTTQLVDFTQTKPEESGLRSDHSFIWAYGIEVS